MSVRLRALRPDPVVREDGRLGKSDEKSEMAAPGLAVGEDAGLVRPPRPLFLSSIVVVGCLAASGIVLVALGSDQLAEPGLQAALARVGRGTVVIFTAHSVPARTISEGDPYEQQAKETAALVAREAGIPDSQWVFAFQSQGMSGGPWIGPTVEDTLRGLKDEGYSQALIQPVGFVCDHVEVLYDIDIGFRKYGSQIGIKTWRTESLNDSPTFIAALADLVRKRLERHAGASYISA